MPNYDLIAFDLDGTIFDGPNKFMRPRVEQIMVAAHNAGVKTAVASGRPVQMLGDDIASKPWIDAYITVNGACTVRASDEKILDQHVMTGWQALVIVECIERAAGGEVKRANLLEADAASHDVALCDLDVKRVAVARRGDGAHHHEARERVVEEAVRDHEGGAALLGLVPHRRVESHLDEVSLLIAHETASDPTSGPPHSVPTLVPSQSAANSSMLILRVRAYRRPERSNLRTSVARSGSTSMLAWSPSEMPSSSQTSAGTLTALLFPHLQRVVSIAHLRCISTYIHHTHSASLLPSRVGGPGAPRAA